MSNALRSERKAPHSLEPCYGCRHHAVCSHQLLACVTYARWIGSMHGKLQQYAPWPDAPRAEIYAVLFCQEDEEYAD